MAIKLTPKPIKVFTRDNPVTKVDLWNCFAKPGGFRRRAVVEARGEIGVNAIKYLLKQEYATAHTLAGVDYWELTPEGEAWLTKGALRFAELHPGVASAFSPPLPGAARVRRVMRRRV